MKVSRTELFCFSVARFLLSLHYPFLHSGEKEKSLSSLGCVVLCVCEREMGESCKSVWSVLVMVLLVSGISGEDPYRFYTWNVTYGDIYPLGVKQQVNLFFFFFLFCFVFVVVYCVLVLILEV